MKRELVGRNRCLHPVEGPSIRPCFAVGAQASAFIPLPLRMVRPFAIVVANGRDEVHSQRHGQSRHSRSAPNAAGHAALGQAKHARGDGSVEVPRLGVRCSSSDCSVVTRNINGCHALESSRKYRLFRRHM